MRYVADKGNNSTADYIWVLPEFLLSEDTIGGWVPESFETNHSHCQSAFCCDHYRSAHRPQDFYFLDITRLLKGKQVTRITIAAALVRFESKEREADMQMDVVVFGE
jgi:hypothetical protein